mmetsp:Transcript_18378/g.47059  ORF Transcript_18378/g.47059 Transcript_18378/m.47059 type:complete len:388 (-) Transcript_18378:360-1523(-)
MRQNAALSSVSDRTSSPSKRLQDWQEHSFDPQQHFSLYSQLDEMSVANATDAAIEQIRESLRSNRVRLLDLFRSWDCNRDGKISFTDFQHGLAHLGCHAPLPVIDSIFQRFEHTRDGHIEYASMNRLLHPTRDHSPAKGHSMSASKRQSTPPSTPPRNLAGRSQVVQGFKQQVTSPSTRPIDSSKGRSLQGQVIRSIEEDLKLGHALSESQICELRALRAAEAQVSCSEDDDKRVAAMVAAFGRLKDERHRELLVSTCVSLSLLLSKSQDMTLNAAWLARAEVARRVFDASRQRVGQHVIHLAHAVMDALRLSLVAAMGACSNRVRGLDARARLTVAFALLALLMSMIWILSMLQEQPQEAVPHRTHTAIKMMHNLLTGVRHRQRAV